MRGLHSNFPLAIVGICVDLRGVQNRPGLPDTMRRAYLDPPAEPIVQTNSGYNWHVIKAVSGKESNVSKTLRDAGVETFCPMQLVTSITRNKLRDNVVALFRNYLFGRWYTDDPYRWHQVMDTTDVIEILGGTDPEIVDPEIVDRWVNRVNIDGILQDDSLIKTLGDLRRGWGVGNFVNCSGAYHGHLLEVLSVDEQRQRVSLRISLLGRNSVIERRVDECSFAGEGPTAGLSDAPSRRALRKRGRRGGHRSRLVRSFRQRQQSR